METHQKQVDESLQGIRRLVAVGGRPLPERHWPELLRRVRTLAALETPTHGPVRRALRRGRMAWRWKRNGRDAGNGIFC